MKFAQEKLGRLDRPDASLETLAALAQQEGVRNVGLLLQALGSEPTPFQAAGELMLGLWVGDELAGVGGRSWCPIVAGALRVRRFYVAPAHRRTGIGRRLALATLDDAGAWCSLVSCNARASPQAAPFWESLGFVRSSIEGVTHTLRIEAAEADGVCPKVEAAPDPGSIMSCMKDRS
jgi:GNAT superfamily N-acetyltransferase